MTVKQTCFEIANLRKQESGLPYDIWLDSAGYKRNTPHYVMRIKVNIDNEFIPVIIASQRDIRPQKHFKRENEIILWASNNYDILFRHWDGELSDIRTLNLLAKY